MFRAVIFDLGNVLIHFDFGIAYRALAEFCRPFSEAEIAEVERLKARCECGAISRQEFESGGMAILGFQGEPATFSRLWQEIFQRNEPMIEFAHSIQARCDLYLLSNTSDIHLEYVLREYPIFGLFKDAVYSHQARLAKPDPAIFAYAAERFGVHPATTIYVDDLLENVKAARDAGFRALHYDARGHDLFLSEILPLLET